MPKSTSAPHTSPLSVWCRCIASLPAIALLWLCCASAQAITNTGPANGTSVFEDHLPLTVSWALGPNEESRHIEFSIWSHPPDISQFGPPNRIGDLATGATSSPSLTIGPGWYLWRVEVHNTAMPGQALSYGPNGYFIVLDTLSASEAADYATRAIARHARHAKISGGSCAKTGVVTARCRFSAFLGDTVWHGKGAVSLSTVPQDNLSTFHYRFKVRRVNTYCLDIRHGSKHKCVKRKRWRQ